MNNFRLRVQVSRLFLLLLFFGLWQWLVTSGYISVFLLPKPTQILTSYIDEGDVYAQAFKETAIASLLGLLISLCFGLILAVLLSYRRSIAEVFLPAFGFLQTVPIVAIAPLMVIWFGFGMRTVAASSFFVSFFPVVASALIGLRSARKEWVDLGKINHATRWREIRFIELPAAVPLIFAGLEVSAGLAVVGAVVGEFISGGGLGGLIDTARTQQKLETMFAAVILSGAVGFLWVSGVHLARTRFQHYFE